MPARLRDVIQPLPEVLSGTVLDEAQDLDHLLSNSLDPEALFAQTHITEGMQSVGRQVFRRLRGENPVGVCRLKQAMGGGKTHTLMVLGALARAPELRAKVDIETGPRQGLGQVEVIGWSGRNRADTGIWMKLAEQLGAAEVFEALHTPLKAPGKNDWIALLRDRKVLILLDEIAPYLAAARRGRDRRNDTCQAHAGGDRQLGGRGPGHSAVARRPSW